MAERTSGIQTVDDRVTSALLLFSVILLRSNIVTAWAEWPQFENGCLQYVDERSISSGEKKES